MVKKILNLFIVILILPTLITFCAYFVGAITNLDPTYFISDWSEGARTIYAILVLAGMFVPFIGFLNDLDKQDREVKG